MSDCRWVKTLLRGLFVLNLSCIYGLLQHCSICLVMQDKFGNLNCSWKADVSSEQSVSLFLQDLTKQDEPRCLLNGTHDINWWVIPRKDLVLNNWYNITITAGDKEETENFSYSHDGHNIFIRPPLLNSSILGTESLEISWTHPDDENWVHTPVKLRYRILGVDSWTEVNDSDLEINTYVLDDPEPYTKYEFQIRYIPDGKNTKRGSLWSETHALMSYEMAPNGSPDVWRRSQNGSALLVMWKPLDHRFARGIILHYLVTYVDGVEKTIPEVPCCSMTVPAESTQVCVSARTSKGLGPPACVTPLCTEVLNTSAFDCTIWGDSDGRMNVLCKVQMKSDGAPSFLVEWRNDRNMEVNWARSPTVSETLMLPDEFTPVVPYYISVYVLYNSSCIRTFSTEAYSREEVPSAAPNFTSYILSVGNVLISWEEIPRQHRRGIITHHTIYVKSTDRCDHYRVSNGSGNKTLSGLLSGTLYTIWMTASTKAGEGERSPHKTFQTGDRHRVWLIVAVVGHILFVGGAVLCFCDCKIQVWPKIPKPEDKFKKLFKASSGNTWPPQQVSLNPLIAVVEEMEPPPRPPTPSPPTPSPPPSLVLIKAPVITSGYERHFMPTAEEVMGFG
ncbi:hypothetical protein GDO78_019810 [Eleutherodactylus coqui]|uniref:Fibronectin type-III domain-containing protein n=1 Tax=Eleutherodactylus coqui TaxID=57060 RepID=A0A8J6EAM7_ELECQ|nr:hypothetical protein GDO78_019810 [Eleutherodactylus coqui]